MHWVVRSGGDPLREWAALLAVLGVAAIPAASVMELFDLEWGGYRGGTFGTLTLVFAGPVFLLGVVLRRLLGSRDR